MADTSTIGAQLFHDLKRDYGLTNEQAAGVVGNLMHESAGFTTLQEVNPVVEGSRGGWGFAQWTGTRRDSFDDYVRRNDLDPSSYAANYGYLKHEIANDRYERGNFNQVKKAQTAEEAARIFSKEYLRPGTPHMSSRVRAANQALGFATTPIPPGELNYAVGTRTSTVPPRKVTPVTPSPSIAAYRAATQAPTSLISIPTASGLGQMMEKGMLTKPVSGTRPTPKSAMTAGSTRIAADTRTFRDANQASRTVGTASKSAVTPQSTRIAADTRLMRSANQASSGVGKPPATRVVQSISRQYLPAIPPSTLDQRLASTPLPRPRPNTTAVVATFPTVARPASAFGSFPQGGRVAAPSQPLTIERAKKLYADMGTQYMSPGPKLTVGQMYAGTPIGAGVQLANAGNRLSPNPSVQSAALAARRGQTAPVQTASARRVAPVPFDRPYFPEGIGGPDLVGLPQKGAPNTSVKNGVKTFSTGKGPLQPNLAQRIGSNFMNNTVAGRAIGGAQVGFDNLAAGRPLLGTPAQQGAALRGIGNALMNNTLGGRLIGMFTGQQPNPLQSVVSFLEPQRANPVGTILGRADNGGQMTQGVNGIMNSITQNSAAWKEATGQQDRYTSNGDGSFTSAGGGVYYDRHIN